MGLFGSDSDSKLELDSTQPQSQSQSQSQPITEQLPSSDSNSSPLTSPIFDPLGLTTAFSTASTSTSTSTDHHSLALNLHHPSAKRLGLSPPHKGSASSTAEEGQQGNQDQDQDEKRRESAKIRKRRSRIDSERVESSHLATSPASLSSNWWDREAVQLELQQRKQKQQQQQQQQQQKQKEQGQQHSIKDQSDQSDSDSDSDTDSNAQSQSNCHLQDSIILDKQVAQEQRRDFSPSPPSPLQASSSSSRPNLRLRSPFESKPIPPSSSTSSSCQDPNDSNLPTPQPIPEDSPASISQSPSNASVSIRSPAADFLSAFSSMHSVVPSPANSYIDESSSPLDSILNNNPETIIASSPSSSASNHQSLLGAVQSTMAQDQASPSETPASKAMNLHSLASSAPSDATQMRNWNGNASGSGSGLSTIAAAIYSQSKANRNPSEIGVEKRSLVYPFNLTRVIPLRPDDQGARIGPSGRYLIGKNIGFGGFSSIKEGWDLGDADGHGNGNGDGKGQRGDLGSGREPEDEEEEKEKEVGNKVQELGRRVAIKLVFNHQKDQEEEDLGFDRDSAKGKEKALNEATTLSENLHLNSLPNELMIWKSLPSHPHLLPLLYYERLFLDGLSHSNSNSSFNQSQNQNPTHSNRKRNFADVLIMPFCDRGSLLDFVRSEGGRRFNNSNSGNGNANANPNASSPASSIYNSNPGGNGNGHAMSSSSSFNGNGNETSLSRSSSLSNSISKPSHHSNFSIHSQGINVTGQSLQSSRSPSTFNPTSSSSGRTGSGFIPPKGKGWKIQQSQLEMDRNLSSSSSISSPVQASDHAYENHPQGEEETRTNGNTNANAVSLSRSSSNRLSSPSPLTNPSPLGRSPSLSSSTILRRASSRAPPPKRSQGISIHQAKDILSQITSALLSLHSKAGIKHGDIKLENVLGQSGGIGKLGKSRGGRRRRRKREESHESDFKDQDQDLDEGDEDEDEIKSQSQEVPLSPLSPETKGFQDLDPTEAIFWRLADFGLAEKVVEDSSPCIPSSSPSSSPGRSRKSRREENKTLSEGISPIEKGKENVKISKANLSQGGSLAYTPPEILRSDPTVNVNVAELDLNPASSSDRQEVSPFAPDMWALGCILYALLSGRLPFADSFEPRLQMKIAKGQWEMPIRLKRRVERLANQQMGATGNSVTSNPTSPMIGPSTSFSSLNGLRDGLAFNRERSGSIELSTRIHSTGFNQSNRNVPISGNRNHSKLPSLIDMSASLPSLPPSTHPHQFHLSSNPNAIANANANANPNSQIVGSAPSAPDPNSRDLDRHSHLEINPIAHLLAQHEQDPESDQDEGNDFDWNGTSNDRAQVREVLHGLLNPDPRFRWNVDQLCNSRWLKGFGPLSGVDGVSRDEVRNRPKQADGDGLEKDQPRRDFVSSHQFASSPISHSDRPSLIDSTISEQPSQERVAVQREEKKTIKRREKDLQDQHESDTATDTALALALATSPLIERIARANGLEPRIGRTRTPPPPAAASSVVSNSSGLEPASSPSRSRSKSLAAANRNRREDLNQSNSASNPYYFNQNNHWNLSSPNVNPNLSQSMVTASSRWGGRAQSDRVELHDDDEDEDEIGDTTTHIRHSDSSDDVGEGDRFPGNRYTSGPNQETQHSWGGRLEASSIRSGDEMSRGRRISRMADVDEDSVWASNDHQHHLHHHHHGRHVDHARLEEQEQEEIRGRRSPAIPISISRDASRSPIGFKKNANLGFVRDPSASSFSSSSLSNRRNRSTDSSLVNDSREREKRSNSSSSRSRSQIRPYSLSTANTASTLATNHSHFDARNSSSPLSSPHSPNSTSPIENPNPNLASAASSRPKTSNIHAQRTSSSRSRSRAPDALANILRESSRDRGSGSGSGSGSRSRSRGGTNSISSGNTNTPLESDADNGKKDNWWERGRGRERKEFS